MTQSRIFCYVFLIKQPKILPWLYVFIFYELLHKSIDSKYETENK